MNNKTRLAHPLRRHAQIDGSVFWPALLATLLAVALMLWFPEVSARGLSATFKVITHQLGFIFVWSGVAFLGLVAWISFGKYGGVRLGGPEARPDFSTLSWIAMFFCSGIGSALIYWAAIEWTYYYQAPPFGLEAGSQRAVEYAAMYGMFHWGPIGWSFYCLTAFPIGYAFYNRGGKGLRLSSACAGIIGQKRADGPLGKLIDVMLIIGLVGATATTLASGTPMLAAVISRLLGVEHTFAVDIAVVCIWTLIFMVSVALGLKKGIKRLSDINLVVVSVLCLLIFVGGPAFFMLGLFTESVGLMITEFGRMAFYTDPVGNSQFPQWWTIFYWAWWAAYGPYMGIFIARISRGRTFREIGVAVTLAGSFGCMLFFMIFGNSMIHAELEGSFPVLATVNEQGPSAAIVGVLAQLPLAWLILPLFVFVGFVYTGTTVDSSAYVMSTVASKDLREGQEPLRYNRLFWAFALGVISLVIMSFGNLESIKAASVIVGLPLVILMWVAFLSLLRWLKEDRPEAALRVRADSGVRADNIV